MRAGILLRRARYDLRTRLSHLPSIYLPLADLRKRDSEGATRVNRATELVLEAFPRSGNTFAVTALKYCQPGPLKVAHHFHAPAQLIRGVRLNKPALVIIRNPMDAVLSLVQRVPFISVEMGLNSWLRFHRAIQPYLAAMEVATFEQVTGDFGAVIDALNQRFGTSFQRFDHTSENVDTVFRAIESRNHRLSGGEAVDESGVARPSTSRREARALLEVQWLDEALSARRDAAQEIYGRIASLSRTVRS